MSTIITRRGFLAGMLAVGAAPAIVRADSLMKIVVPKREIIRISSLSWPDVDSDGKVVQRSLILPQTDGYKVAHHKQHMVLKKDGRLEPFDFKKIDSITSWTRETEMTWPSQDLINAIRKGNTNGHARTLR